MKQPFADAFAQLIDAVSALPGITAIGKSGGAQLPEPGESDIDLFVFCAEVPRVEDRLRCMAMPCDARGARCGESPGPFWGTCDFLDLAGGEVCLMYFTEAAMDAELDAVLRGERLDQEGGYFYPTGRCASMLSLHALLDRDGYIARTQARLAEYPAALADALVARHLPRIFDDEDFERAAARGDVLFYHATLDRAIDHFLQALFARNRAFFPSRKRSLQWIAGFDAAPERCGERLLQAVALGARAETVRASVDVWAGLCEELRGLVG